MIRFPVFRKKIKLYNASLLKNKTDFVRYLNSQLVDWNVISGLTANNKFIPKTDFTAFLGFNIAKPAEKLIFVSDFSFELSDNEQKPFIILTINFTNLFFILFFLLIISLIIIFSKFFNNDFNLNDVYHLLYGLSISFIIYSSFYITITLKLLTKYLKKIIDRFNRLNFKIQNENNKIKY